jgi:hypothetical protein
MEPNTKLCKLLNHIGNELKILWWQMDAYQEIFFVEPEKRQTLLQNTAPGFFAITEVSFAESILLRAFRLMDPTKSRNDENTSIQHLQDLLSNADPAQVRLKKCIDSIRSDWKKADGPYAGLKIIRNKRLAHNDFIERSALDANQLWINFTAEEFNSARRLVGQLWGIYWQCNRELWARDVIEPQHRNFDNRPSMLLKHLCASLYLESLAKDDHVQALKLQAFEIEKMGLDQIRRVFIEQAASQAGPVAAQLKLDI